MAKLNDTVGGYKLKAKLHAGPTSEVYEVVEPSSGRHFAMKVLKDQFAADADQRKMLFHEAAVGTALKHENVVTILKVSQSADAPHFVMEYFSAGSLGVRLKSKDPADAQFLKDFSKVVFKQVAVGLAYMNETGYVHKDVKPDNVLVDAGGRAKIIDFAISQKMKSGLGKLLHRKGKPQGTPSYMSPEQIRDEAIDGRADLYSYGAMLYELTTGKKPFTGSTTTELLNKHLSATPDAPAAVNPDVTADFSALVMKMLAKDRDARPAGFHEVLVALKPMQVFKSSPLSGKLSSPS
jgi:serine/threonine protein kinase